MKLDLTHQWSNVPLIKSPLVEDDDEQDTNSGSGPDLEKSTDERDRRRETAWFRHFTHSTNVELFYDLFFVANLTAFTGVHEVNDENSLRGYVGFFCILWFTWYQVSLYEVRFGMDSVVERVGKAVQFLVMIVFAVCGPQYQIGDEASYLGYFRGLTIALMVSRLVLVGEYLQVLWFARSRNKNILIPIGIITAIYFIAAMIYLGLYWAFTPTSTTSYIGWYCVAPIETAAVTLVSTIWKSLSFSGTHLVERMSLLTLILFGEGAIQTARAVQTLAASDGVFTFYGSNPAMIVCAVLNLYFMYMIYYDWLHEELFGTVRMQLWSAGHFPLHVAIALSVEGAAQCITWNAGIVATNSLFDDVYGWSNRLFHSGNASASLFNAAALSLNDTANNLFTQQLATSDDFYSTALTVGDWIQKDRAAIPTIMNGATNPDAAKKALTWLTGVLYNTIFKIAQFAPPTTEQERVMVSSYVETTLDFNSNSTDFVETAAENILQAWSVFELTFVYFFVATGCFLLILTILAFLNGGRRTKGTYLRMWIMRLVGTALALLSTMASTTSVLEQYVQSPWILPTVTLSLFIVVAVDATQFPGEKGSAERR